MRSLDTVCSLDARAQVLASWAFVFQGGATLKLRLEDVTVHATESLGARAPNSRSFALILR